MTERMDRVSRLIDAVSETAWAQKLDVLENMCSIIRRHDLGERLSPDEVLAYTNPKNLLAAAAATGGSGGDGKPYQVVGSVAVITVGGVIAKYSRQVNGISSPRGTSLESFTAAVQAADLDPAIASKLIVFDSPGGSVSGLWQAMDDLRASAQVKPTWAWVSDLCASAALGLACMCLRTYASAGAGIGSLGVFTVVVDASRAAQNEGYEFIVIGSGGVKGAGVMGTRLTDEYKAKVQAEINALTDELLTRIPLGRKNLTIEAVRAMADGSMFIGKQAVDKGLIDGNRPLPDVLAEMNRLYKPQGRAASLSLGNGNGGGASAAVVMDQGTRAGGTGQELDMSRSALIGAAALVLAAGAGAEGAAGGGAGGDAGNGSGNAAPPVSKLSDAQAKDLQEAGKKAERDRIAGINRWAARFAHVPGVTDKAAKAIEGDTTVDAFEKQLLDAVADGAKATGFIGVGDPGSKRQADAMTTVLLHKACPGLRQQLAAGDPFAEQMANALGYVAANGKSAAACALAEYREAETAGLRGMRAFDMMRACVQAVDPQAARTLGYGNDIALFQRALNSGPYAIGAHTTSDFPSILANLAGKVGAKAFLEEKTTWQEWVEVGNAGDYKPGTTVSLSNAQDLQQIVEGDFAKKVSFSERQTTISVKPFGLRFGWTYQMARNDDLGMFLKLPSLFNVAAARLPDILVYQLLQLGSGLGPAMEYDNKRLIHDDHRNVLTSAALAYASAQAAIVKFSQQVGMTVAAGETPPTLGLTPEFLIVPPALKFAAELLYKNQYAPGTNDANLVGGVLRPVISSRLTGSATRWWIAGSKSNSSIEVRFLDGQQTPRIDTITNGNPLEQEMQVTLMGVGAGARNHENIASNAGTP